MPLLPGFYPILDTLLLSRAELELVPAAEAILDGGARILQLRHKEHFSRAVFDAAEHIQTLCHAAGALFVINDRADMAALLGAALHLGQEDLSPAHARQLLPHAIIGFSTHNEAQLLAAAPELVDYIALGPIFGTASKDHPDPIVGIPELRRLRPLTPRPLVGIGGITRQNAGEVWDAGADSVAVIGDLLNPPCTYSDLRQRSREWCALTQPGAHR